MADYKIVGYVSRAGKLGAYKQKLTVKNKFGEGNRVLLESFGSNPITFWTDEIKLVDAPLAAAEAAARHAKRCDCGDCSDCEWNDDQNFWTPANPLFSQSRPVTDQFDENDVEQLAE